MTLEVRAATSEDWPVATRIDEIAFGFTATDDREQARRLFELDRTVFGLDEEGREVGLASIYSLTMSVPGGLVPMAGVTWVGVLPTHRRRGVASAMLRRLTDDVRERGTEPVMALWALDPGIYGRFGYGVATHAYQCSIPTSRGTLAYAPPTDGLTVSLADPADVRDELAVLAERVVAHRPGGLPRTSAWWDLFIEDRPDSRGGASAKRALIVRDADGPRAFARFRTKFEFESPVPTGELLVLETASVDPQAAALLWRTLIGHDIVTTVKVINLPCDDPLLAQLGDARSPKPTLVDALHVRIVDVPRALGARTYATQVDVVLDLDDPFAPWCTGRYRLTGGPEGAVCAPTEDAADVALGAAELGAVYLGGTRLSVLADAGRVRELTPGAVSSTSRALLADRQPWCPFVF